MAQGYVDNQYWKSQVMTASPGRLLLMTYDGGLRFLRLAGDAMARRDLENQHINILKAQSIVLELINTLDHSINSQLAGDLERIYRYVYDRLTEANVRDDLRALREAETMLTRLREAWAEADAQMAQSPTSQ